MEPLAATKELLAGGVSSGMAAVRRLIVSAAALSKHIRSAGSEPLLLELVFERAKKHCPCVLAIMVTMSGTVGCFVKYSWGKPMREHKVFSKSLIPVMLLN